LLRRAKGGERFRPADRRRGDHVPPDEHLFEQAPVRGVVVDDPGGRIPQSDCIRNRRDTGGVSTGARLAVKWKVLPLP